MKTVLILFAAMAVGASCASSDQTLSTAAQQPAEAECDASGAFTDLSYGLPPFDYDHADTIDELLAGDGLVVQGQLVNAQFVSSNDGGSGTTVLALTGVSSLNRLDEEVDLELTVGYPSAGGDEAHPLSEELVFEPPVEIIAVLTDEFQTVRGTDVRSASPQGIYLRCPDERIHAVLGPLPGDASEMDFFELVDTLYAKAPQPEPRSTGPTRSIPYRLLAEDLAEGQPWSTAVVPDGTEGFDVDWATEVIFEFNLAESSSCPFGAMTDLRFDELNNVLFPVVPLAEDFDGCNADANPHLIRVAIERADLPTQPFELWVNGSEPPSGVADGVTVYTPATGD